VKIRPAARAEVARFFRAVLRTRMQSETELLSAERLKMADECFVALINGKIVGAVCLVLDEGKCSELLTEYVLKEHEGQGIGSQLTKAAIERLIAIGRAPIYINVASKGMDRTLDKLPKKVRRHLRLNRSYLAVGEVELPER
jgi:GNAT superfamily N-acetyltransferase